MSNEPWAERFAYARAEHYVAQGPEPKAQGNKKGAFYDMEEKRFRHYKNLEVKFL